MNSVAGIQPVINAVDRINKVPVTVRDAFGSMPWVSRSAEDRFGPGNTGERFATLMRILCQKNGGTFVGLNSTSR